MDVAAKSITHPSSRIGDLALETGGCSRPQWSRPRDSYGDAP
jgi:hypothetical protein